LLLLSNIVPLSEDPCKKDPIIKGRKPPPSFPIVTSKAVLHYQRTPPIDTEEQSVDEVSDDGLTRCEHGGDGGDDGYF
jgi:hypothetical protein